MTETTEHSEESNDETDTRYEKIRPALGEDGTRWGVNRTVAQIHVLLFLASDLLNAEDITETLGVARSNVSTSIKELQSWKLVKTVHLLGDRRDHFETMKDPWELFYAIIEGRKQRELDPTMSVLRECVWATKMTKKRLRRSNNALRMCWSLRKTWIPGIARLRDCRNQPC